MNVLKNALLVNFLFGVNILNINGDKSNLDIIVTFLKKLNEPIQVIGFLCWNKDEILLLYKLFSAKQIRFANHHYSKMHDNDTFFYNNLPSLYKFYLMDSNCDNSLEILKMAEENNLFSFPHKWLCLNEQPPINLYLPVNSRVYVLENMGNNSKELISIYKTNNLEPNFIRNNIAFVHQNKFGELKKLSDIKNRRDLKRKNINITLVITVNSTKRHLNDEREKHIDPLTKLNYNILILLGDILNLNISFNFQNTWGYYNLTTNKFDGLYGDLQNNISEIGGTSSYMREDRLELADFIASICNMKVRFILRSPPLSTTMNIFLLPFHVSVWMACLIIIVIIFAILLFISRWEFEVLKTDNVRNSVRPNFGDVSQLVIGAITQQGAESELRSDSGRIAILSVFVALMFIYVSYSAKIVTLLQSNSNSFKSIQDLLTTRIKLGLDDVPYNHFYFTKLQTDGIRTQIVEEKIENREVFTSLENGVRKMKNEFYAFHAEVVKVYKVVLETFQEHEKCNLIEIDFLNTGGIYIPIRKRSEYKELLKVSFILTRERGMQSRFNRKYELAKPICQGKNANFISVSLLDCYFALLLFLGGIVLALILFFIEIMVFKKI